MFIDFHKNRARYDKGQVSPFLILVVVIVIIMAMMTVNLSKVATIKTDSSNAADAGGLAASAVMANVFNGIAMSNSQMIASYWEFYAAISVSFALALGLLIAAQSESKVALGLAGSALAKATVGEGAAGSALEAARDNEPALGLVSTGVAVAALGAAEGFMDSAIAAIATANSLMALMSAANWAILIAIIAFGVAQLYFYRMIRRSAEEGTGSAITLGHKFAFMNSGIGAKLREGEQRRNFSAFLDREIGDQGSYVYPWTDGQDRDHSVTVNVHTDPVDTFELKVAAFCMVIEGLLMRQVIILSKATIAELVTTGISYTTAATSYFIAAFWYAAAAKAFEKALSPHGCEGSHHPGCWIACAGLRAAAALALGFGLAANSTGIAANGAGMTANSAAIATMIEIYPFLAAAWAGLLPVLPWRSHSSSDAIPQIICWIEDVVHNRLVTINTTQFHQEQDMGLWRFRYPDNTGEMTSSSTVTFLGRGKIYPPVLRHDASIVETDRSVVYDVCPERNRRVGALEAQITNLQAAAQQLDAQATDFEEQVTRLRAMGQTDSADKLALTAATLRNNAVIRRQEVAYNEELMDEIRQDNAGCFNTQGGG